MGRRTERWTTGRHSTVPQRTVLVDVDEQSFVTVDYHLFAQMLRDLGHTRSNART